MTMRRVVIATYLLVFFSFQKENDVFNYTPNYSNPFPEKNTESLNLRYNFIGFSSIERTGLVEYVKEYRVYFDTVYPPVQILKSSTEEILNCRLPNLIPDQQYYWTFSTLLPSGEVLSDLLSLKAPRFSGVWNLESVADKRGMLNSFYNSVGGNYNWTNWDDWNETDYESSVWTVDGEEYFTYRSYQVNKDSLLNAEAEIGEIDFNSGNITILNSNEKAIASFFYDKNKCSLLIQDKSNNQDYEFATANVGYISHYNKGVLLLITEQGIMFIYSKA